MSRWLTIAGYALLGLVLVGLHARAVLSREPGRYPTAGDVLRVLMAWGWSRWVILFCWWWLGWHLFVR